MRTNIAIKNLDYHKKKILRNLKQFEKDNKLVVTDFNWNFSTLNIRWRGYDWRLPCNGFEIFDAMFGDIPTLQFEFFNDNKSNPSILVFVRDKQSTTTL